MRFTLRQLEFFVMVAETGTLTRASELLRISTPSISAAISALEKELKVQLFIRHHAKGVSITPEGRQVLKEAKLIVERAQNLPQLAGDLGEKISGPLSIGAMTTLAATVVPQLASKFVKQHPDINLTFVEAAQDELMRKLFNSEISFALTYDISLHGDMRFTKLIDLPPHVLLPDNHHLAKEESIDLASLADEDYVMLDLPLSYEYFISVFKANDVKPKIRYRSPNIEFIRSTVANGFGYSLINTKPKSHYALDGKKLRSIPLLHGEKTAITLGLATIHRPYTTRLQRSFEDFCKQHITQKTIPGAII